MTTLRRYKILYADGAINMDLCYTHVWALREQGIRCLPLSRPLVKHCKCFKCWLESDNEPWFDLPIGKPQREKIDPKQATKSIRLYRVTDYFGVYDTKLCYTHVWAFREMGSRCIPLSKPLMFSQCWKCFLAGGEDFYYRDYHAPLVVKGG